MDNKTKQLQEVLLSIFEGLRLQRETIEALRVMAEEFPVDLVNVLLYAKDQGRIIAVLCMITAMAEKGFAPEAVLGFITSELNIRVAA